MFTYVLILSSKEALRSAIAQFAQLGDVVMPDSDQSSRSSGTAHSEARFSAMPSRQFTSRKTAMPWIDQKKSELSSLWKTMGIGIVFPVRSENHRNKPNAADIAANTIAC